MKSYSIFLPSLLVMLMLATVSYGQKRSDELNSQNYSGPIIKKRDPSQGANLSNLFNMKMSQSFSASFSSFGGHVSNLNAFTNSMQFYFSKNLTGQVDVSLLNAPFGLYNFAGDRMQQKLQVALNAQLDYQINENMDIHLQVNRAPGGYGYYSRPFGSPYTNRPYLGY